MFRHVFRNTVSVALVRGPRAAWTTKGASGIVAAMSRSSAEATATAAREPSQGAARAAGTSAMLFLALACDAPTSGGAAHALRRLDRILVGRGPERSGRRASGPDGRVLTIELPSALVSRAHARFERVLGDWLVVDEGSRNGTFVNGERVTKHTLSDGDVIECGQNLFVYRSAIVLGEGDDDQDIDPRRGAPLLATLLPELRDEARVLARVAAARIPVLLLGESGSGKEIAARAIHELSGRAGALVPVNCGAIPDGLVESQLFGHVRGAFSGATRDEPGVFRAADRGTLFLDEIGDLPLASQVALLRCLEDGVVTPVGTTRGLAVDTRVVAATNRPLEALVDAGTFRADLLARLSGYVHRLTPLRERREDLGILIAALLPQLTTAPVTFTPAAGLRLLAHDWPLNVRELRACLAAALVTAGDRPIDADHLHFPFASRPKARTLEPTPSPTPEVPARGPALTEAELVTELTRLLTEHQGNVAAVARAMGKAPYQIHRWLKQLGLDLAAFRPPR